MTSKKALVLVGTIVLLVVAVVAFWLGQKDTIKITSGDRAIAQITEKMMRGEYLTPAEQRAYQDMQNKAANEASKFFGLPTAAAPVAPAGVNLPPGVELRSWTRALNTKFGQIKINYTETESAKKKIATWPEVDASGEPVLFIKNLQLSRYADGVMGETYKDAKGKIIKTNTKQIYLKPLEVDELALAYFDMEGAKTVEISVEF